nr:hypothetical protein [Tanacetum cinerariifolium]
CAQEIAGVRDRFLAGKLGNSGPHRSTDDCSRRSGHEKIRVLGPELIFSLPRPKVLSLDHVSKRVRRVQ